MPRAHANSRFLILVAAIAAGSVLPGVAAVGQEVGVHVGGGVGGIRDVRRPFGGGVDGALLLHDWLGIRLDAGYYWTLEHRTALDCRPGVLEPICTTNHLASQSHFPQLEALAILRGHIPGKGVRVELGAGPTWLRVTNEIRANRDSVYSAERSSSAAGAMVFAGILVHPPWQLPLELEGAYAYHMTGAFGACTNQPNDPLCAQRLHFHELRATLVFRPRR